METKILTEIVKGTFSLLTQVLANIGQQEGPSEYNIESHIKDCLNWSSKLQFFGMPQPLSVDSNSVAIDISSIPRKFKGEKSSGKQIKEENILSSGNHYILLGSPGSGKTTTIKRLVRLILTAPPVSEEDIYQYPILIRLRELIEGESIYLHIAKLLGVKIRSEIIESNSSGQRFKENLNYIGKEILEDAIPNILDSTNAILFIDGLDEVSKGYRKTIESQIISIARKMSNSKILISCRSGDYSTEIEGFNVIELCDLTNGQIEEIVDKWADSPNEFMSRLSLVPYKDLSNRPLLLTQLILIFNKTGYLPEKAIDVYDKIIRLLLEEWDQRRKILRHSNYVDFSPVNKKKFLSALAFDLLYKQKKKRFSNKDMLSAYSKIHRKFKLTESEAELVIDEIESHTGLIVSSGYDHYEFSHLSLQEYLCACYLVGSPLARNVILYLKEYPAPLAIAVALSSEPSAWFSMIILSQYDENDDIYNNIITLIDRINIEGVNFEESSLLGFALIKLISSSRSSLNTKFKKIISWFTESESFIKSINIALNFSRIDLRNTKNGTHSLERRCKTLNEHELNYVELPKLSEGTINEIISLCGMAIQTNISEPHMIYFG